MIWTTTITPPPEVPYGRPLLCVGRHIEPDYYFPPVGIMAGVQPPASPWTLFTFADLHGNTFSARLKGARKKPGPLARVLGSHLESTDPPPAVGEWTMRVRGGDMVLIDPQPSIAALRELCETVVRVNVEPGCWEGIAPPKETI